MAHGREDFTFLADTDIIAQTIGNIATDIAAQSVGNLAVDIVAQALAALKVDITAQTLAQLDVDIIAQTLAEMAVNITAQDLAQLIINIAAQDVGIYLQPEWAALQGVDKNFACNNAAADFNESGFVSYTVPAGKTLYICGFSFSSQVNAGGGYDHFVYAQGIITVGGVTVVSMGGLAGGGLPFPKPIVVAAGVQMILLVFNRSNIECFLTGTEWGYEI